MSRVVWKYEVPLDGLIHEVELPVGAQIVSVAAQEGLRLHFWAVVRLGRAETEARHFLWLGTGHDIPFGVAGFGRFEHRGTVHAGAYVWHLFEAVP